MEDGESGQLGPLVRQPVEEEVVVKIDLAIPQHQLTVEKFALVLHMKNWKNAIVMNVRVIFCCLNAHLKCAHQNIFYSYEVICGS